MITARIVIFSALSCVGLSSCSKVTSADPSEKYLGTYFVKRNTEMVSPGTGNHFFRKDSFLLTVTKSTVNSEIRFSSQDNWTAALDENHFIIVPYSTKQSYAEIGHMYVTGFGTFSGDSISYTENLNGGIGLHEDGSNENLPGRSKIIGVKQ